MHLRFLTLFIGMLLAVVLTTVHAESDKFKYQKALQQISAGNLTIKAINDTPISGMKELTVNTGRSIEVLYISEDGNYIFNGNVFDIKNKTDITAQKKAGLRKDYLSHIGDSKRINYFPEGMRHKVTVFTDIDCPYCRQLHAQIAEYNKLGIGISYLFYPRSGLNTPSAEKAITVWCSDNRKQAMDKSFEGADLNQLQCDNPVADHYNSGVTVGVTGTPAMILSDGTMLPGLLSPQQLQQRLVLLKPTETN